MHGALAKQPINQLKPVQQSRQQVLSAYSPNIYTVKKGIIASRDIEPFELIMFEKALAVGPKLYDSSEKVLYFIMSRQAIVFLK